MTMPHVDVRPTTPRPAPREFDLHPFADPTRVHLCGAFVDLMEQDQAIATVVAAAKGGPPLAVVSANLDHLHHFGTGGRWHGVIEQSAAAGQLCWLSLLDGAPLVHQAGRLTGESWPRLAGSDLIEPILDAAEAEGLTVGFLGGAAETQERLRTRLAHDLPSLRVAGWWAPPREAIADPAASTRLAVEVREASVDVLVVGMGKPRQELWIAEYGPLTGARVLLAFGAVVDFLAGHVQRAPSWMAQHGLEWSYRLAQEPRRLSRRYLVDGPVAYQRLRRATKPDPLVTPAAEPGPPIGLFVGRQEPADVTVVIVAHNSASSLPQLIQDLRREAGPLRLRVVVVDNASTDQTLDLLQGHPDVLTVAQRNVGYAGGINAGMAQAGDCRAVLILNPDLRLEDGAVMALWRRVWQPGVAVAVPRVLDDEGHTSPSLRFEPGILRGLGDALLGRRLLGRPTWLTEMDYNHESYQHPHPIDWATGACLLIRLDVARRVGPWDERYFLYSEEVDFMRRVRESGLSTWYEPTSRVHHQGGGSGSSAELDALLAVNRVRYAKAHHGRAYAAGTLAVVTAATVLRSRDAGQRRATGYLLRPRRWSSLPAADRAGATGSPEAPLEEDPTTHLIATPRGSIVMPAHNEEALIQRTLRPLREMVTDGTVELVVAANGCTDATASLAREVSGARVLDLPEPSKVHALNAGDEAAQGWPRLYLDADILITPRAVLDVFAALSTGRALAARPPFTYDSTGASWLVRAYYRARQRLPETSAHLWGAGAYAISREGRRRFASFPDVVADDLFVDSLFEPNDKVVVDTDPVVVRTPRNLEGLMAILRRTYRGLHEAGNESAPTASTTFRELVMSVRGPSSLVDALVYASLAVAGRRRPSGAGHRWERDDTSRVLASPDERPRPVRRPNRLSTINAAATARPRASNSSPASARFVLPATKVM